MVYNKPKIPWGVHRRVKEYADRNDMAIQEAYAHLLERGLADADATQ
jgi:hypothetical protein